MELKIGATVKWDFEAEPETGPSIWVHGQGLVSSEKWVDKEHGEIIKVSELKDGKLLTHVLPVDALHILSSEEIIIYLLLDAIIKLGGDSYIQGIISTWRDGDTDEETINHLNEWLKYKSE